MASPPLALGSGNERRELRKCGAKTRAGGTCKNWARPNGRCRLHGGLSLAGPLHPRWRGGGKSKYVPDRLWNQYRESMENEKWLELREEIALVDAQIADILVNLDDEVSDSQWQSIVTHWIEFMSAIKGQDSAKQIEMVYKLDEVIDAGTNYHSNLDRLNKMIDRRSRLVSAEIKNRATSQQMLAIEIVIALLAKLAMAVKEACQAHAPPDVARKIIHDTNITFTNIIGSPNDKYGVRNE